MGSKLPFVKHRNKWPLILVELQFTVVCSFPMLNKISQKVHKMIKFQYQYDTSSICVLRCIFHAALNLLLMTLAAKILYLNNN